MNILLDKLPWTSLLKSERTGQCLKVWRSDCLELCCSLWVVYCQAKYKINIDAFDNTLVLRQYIGIGTIQYQYRMCKVVWTELRTNRSVIVEFHIVICLSFPVNKRNLQFLVLILERDGQNFETLILQGKVEGNKPWGRTLADKHIHIRSVAYLSNCLKKNWRLLWMVTFHHGYNV